MVGRQTSNQGLSRGGICRRPRTGFRELFAPTDAFSNVRWWATLACEENLNKYHFDIEQAFVQSDLDGDVFMRLPQSCSRLSGMIVKLNKSLYGLKQASRQ